MALSDGPTGHGSTISGAHAFTLSIANPDSADAGSYHCVFSNFCGSATSSAVTLAVNNCCDGDIVGNGGEVNIDDLIAVITSWGACPPLPEECLADLNGTGGVDIDDLVMLITNWGSCP